MRKLTYLLDTNVIVEFLLNQEKAEEAEQFLQGIPPDEMYFTDFCIGQNDGGLKNLHETSL